MKKYILLYASHSDIDDDLYVDSLGTFDTYEQAEACQKENEAEDAEDTESSVTRVYKIKEVSFMTLSVQELGRICDVACRKFNLSGASNLSSEDAPEDKRCYTFVSGNERQDDSERVKALHDCKTYLVERGVTVKSVIVKYGGHSYRFDVCWKDNCVNA